MIHDLKTNLAFFQAVKAGTKTFELRFNDRKFQVGDTLCLLEYDALTQRYTGDGVCATVTYLLEGPWLAPGYVAMAIKVATE